MNTVLFVLFMWWSGSDVKCEVQDVPLFQWQGVVNHGTRHGLKAPPKFYSPQVAGFRPVQISSLEFCSNGQAHFLVSAYIWQCFLNMGAVCVLVYGIVWTCGGRGVHLSVFKLNKIAYVRFLCLCGSMCLCYRWAVVMAVYGYTQYRVSSLCWSGLAAPVGKRSSRSSGLWPGLLFSVFWTQRPVCTSGTSWKTNSALSSQRELMWTGQCRPAVVVMKYVVYNQGGKVSPHTMLSDNGRKFFFFF